MSKVKIDRVIKTKRKTISLCIDNEANLVVRAPEFATYKQIEKVVQSHATWIEKTKTKISKRILEKQEESKVKKDKILFLGRYFPLVLQNNCESDDLDLIMCTDYIDPHNIVLKNMDSKYLNCANINDKNIGNIDNDLNNDLDNMLDNSLSNVLDNVKIPVNFPLKFKDGKFYLCKIAKDKKNELLVKWYRYVAFSIIRERTQIYSIKYDISFDKIRITNAQTRWGSCYKRDINFTYRLIMAPIFVIDYVITHELLHILVKNHSKFYWEKVEKVMPDYKDRRKWLKENGYRLEV